MNNQQRVPVFDHDGNQVGDVGITATSIGASKITGVAMSYAKRNGKCGWYPTQRKEDDE